MTAPHQGVPQAHLSASFWECGRHCAALVEALSEWHALPTPGVQALETDPTFRHLSDRILYRFAKLQDAMGERLLPASLSWLKEPYDDRSVRDRLDRLEKLGYLNVEVWTEWRSLRNKLAHEYPDSADMRHKAMLEVVVAAAGMAAVFEHWRGKLPPSLTDAGTD